MPPVDDRDDEVSGYVTERQIWKYIEKHGGLDLNDLMLYRSKVV